MKIATKIADFSYSMKWKKSLFCRSDFFNGFSFGAAMGKMGHIVFVSMRDMSQQNFDFCHTFFQTLVILTCLLNV
jgi:hypothetical protein